MTDAVIYFPPFYKKIRTCLKELFESKHLYQSLRFDLGGLQEHTPENWREPLRSKVWSDFQRFVHESWLVNDPSGRKGILSDGEIFVILEFPSVKLYCANCKRNEPYNLIGATSIDYIFSNGENGREDTIQQFAVTYQCQSCKKHPETFLVRREGYKFTICGRSPIEIIDTPKDIPRTIEDYYSKAIISHHSGFTLAGIFYLRTLVEQWIYSLESSHGTADKAVEWYMTTLPDDFKSRFKSMKELYGELSSDIHSAKGSEELFIQSVRDVEAHFEARRVFNL